MITREQLSKIRHRLQEDTYKAQYEDRNVVSTVDEARDLCEALAELDEYKRAEAEDLAIIATKAECFAERLADARDTLQTLEDDAAQLEDLIGRAAEAREVTL